jgi:hypothetical protein
VILRCTKKLLAVLGAGHAAEPGPPPNSGDWYANLLWLDRRKCLLLTHAATLFSIFEADVRAADPRATRRLVTALIERELGREGLPPATFANLRSQELILAKTADRSVLGCMNDIAFRCEVAISDGGGLAHVDLGELNHRLHRHINSSRGYRPPVELAAEQLGMGITRTRHRPAPDRDPASCAIGLPAKPR